MAQRHDPPNDMLKIVVPFIKRNKEYVVEDTPPAAHYYRLNGTKTESHYYFVIGIKTRFGSNGPEHLISFLPYSSSVTSGTNKWAPFHLLQIHLDNWLKLIKEHRSYFEDEDQHQPEESAPGPVMEIEPQPALETFNSLVAWAENSGRLSVKDRALNHDQLRIHFEKFARNKELTKKLMAEFLDSPESIINKNKITYWISKYSTAIGITIVVAIILIFLRMLVPEENILLLTYISIIAPICTGVLTAIIMNHHAKKQKDESLK